MPRQQTPVRHAGPLASAFERIASMSSQPPSEETRVDQVVDHIDHEQRIAIGAFMDHCREAVGLPRTIAGKAFREVTRIVLLTQQL